jgi:hypothetical protein
VTPGEILEVARGMRKLGVAGFRFRDCEVTFFDQLPVEVAMAQDDDDEADEEDRAKRLARARKALLDADIHGSA